MKDTVTIGNATTISPGVYTTDFGGIWDYITRGTIVYGGFDGVIVTFGDTDVA